MTEKIDLPSQPDGTGGNSSASMLWLFVAFIPSLASIPFLQERTPPEWAITALLILAAACCLSAGFGVLARLKDAVLRIVLGIILAGAFFVLNVLVVLFIGCTGMGRIAP